jgi:large subunit ribosomal protein L19
MTEQMNATLTTAAELKPGMIVRLHEKIQDLSAKGEPRERVQIFEGMITAVRGAGASRSFTIRKESNGYGVEKIFPVTSPAISKLELVKVYKVRRAKLGFIKDFGRKLKELIAAK